VLGIAQKYGRTPAQILMAWQWQQVSAEARLE
jgi:diketogulonate reductase-like aldo/keto reductase